MENLKAIKKQDKYTLIMVIGNKTKIISSSKYKYELKKKAIEKLHKIAKNILLLNDKIIFQLSIKKGNKKHPLVIVIEEIQISVKEKKNKYVVKFKNLGEISNNKVYVDNKFIEKKNKIDNKYLRNIVLQYYKGKLNIAFSIFTLSNLYVIR